MELFLLVSALLYFIFIRGSRMDVLSRGILYVFVGYWHFILIGALMSNDILFPPRYSSVFILWIAMTVFVVGFCSLHISQKLWIKVNYTGLESTIVKLLNNKVLILLMIAYALYMLWCFRRFFVQVEMMGIVGDLRGEFFDSQNTDLYGSTFNTLRSWVLEPVDYILSALMCYCFLKYRKPVSLLILSGLFFYNSLAGGRFGYLRMIVSVVVVFLLFYTKSNRIKFRFRSILVGLVGGCAIFILLTFVTTLRKGTFDGFNMQTIEDGLEMSINDVRAYNFGPVVAFDKALENDSFKRRAGGYKYGGNTFGALVNIYWMISRHMFGDDFEQPYIGVSKAQQDTKISIGPERHSWNALYTWNIGFYIDLSYFGIIMFNFLIGLWMRSVIRMFYRKPTLSSFILLCTLFRLVVWSVFNTTFNSLSMCLMIVFLYYFHKREKSFNNNTSLLTKRLIIRNE